MSYNTERNKEYLKERYHKQRRCFIAYLGAKCAICNTTEDLEIDHINPSKKLFPMSKLWSLKDLPKVFLELDKCQLLCNSCHINKTVQENSGVERGWTHGTIYGWMRKKCNCEECVTAKWLWHDKRNAERRSKREPYNTKRSRRGGGTRSTHSP